MNIRAFLTIALLLSTGACRKSAKETALANISRYQQAASLLMLKRDFLLKNQSIANAKKLKGAILFGDQRVIDGLANKDTSFLKVKSLWTNDLLENGYSIRYNLTGSMLFVVRHKKGQGGVSIMFDPKNEYGPLGIVSDLAKEKIEDNWYLHTFNDE